MKVSREQVAENRRKILDTAAELFREKGFDAVSVADIMAGAGLTHGGFYGYFDSKDALIAAALVCAKQDSLRAEESLPAFIRRYLSTAHRDNPAVGCAVAPLAADVARMSPGVRDAMTAVLAQQLEALAAKAEGETPAQRRQNAIGTYAALIGGLTLARMSNDESLSAEVLDATMAFLSGPVQP